VRFRTLDKAISQQFIYFHASLRCVAGTFSQINFAVFASVQISSANPRKTSTSLIVLITGEKII
jgi:hypothetical protein